MRGEVEIAKEAYIPQHTITITITIHHIPILLTSIPELPYQRPSSSTSTTLSLSLLPLLLPLISPPPLFASLSSRFSLSNHCPSYTGKEQNR